MKSNFWALVDGIIFTLSIIILVVILPSIKNLESCPDPTGTPFALLVSAYCNFGFLGILLIVLALITFVLGIIFLVNNSKK